VEVAAPVIAIIGLTLAAVSLAWQARRSSCDPRVKVILREGLRGDHGGALLGPIASYFPEGELLIHFGETSTPSEGGY
jgi:hypothetical protein